MCVFVRYAKLARADSTIVIVSRFITEYAMSSYSLSTNYLPSQVAAAGILIFLFFICFLATSLALRIVNRPPWTATLQKESGYKHDDLLCDAFFF
jgi:hypothetical protein